MATVGEALKAFEEMLAEKHKYIEEQDPDETGDWSCAMEENIDDYNVELAHLGEALAKAVREYLYQGEN